MILMRSQYKNNLYMCLVIYCHINKINKVLIQIEDIWFFKQDALDPKIYVYEKIIIERDFHLGT